MWTSEVRKQTIQSRGVVDVEKRGTLTEGEKRLRYHNWNMMMLTKIFSLTLPPVGNIFSLQKGSEKPLMSIGLIP
jgi:hypothetical protein